MSFERETCDYCEQAQTKPDFAGYRADCRGCKVRSFSNGPFFWDAQKAGKLTKRYREALEKTFGKEGAKQAHEDIKREHQRLEALREAFDFLGVSKAGKP